MSKHLLANLPDVLSVKQVSALIHVCEKTVYKLIHDKQLFAIRIGKSFRIPKQALLSFIGALSPEISSQNRK